MATKKDAKIIAEIHNASWKEAYSGIIPEEIIESKCSKRYENWINKLSQDNLMHYIIKINNKIIGIFGVYDPQDEQMDNSYYELHYLYLHPEYWGKGYGREAINFVKKISYTRGKQNLILWVLEKNKRARHFYEKCGFNFDGIQNKVVIGIPLTELRYSYNLTF